MLNKHLLREWCQHPPNCWEILHSSSPHSPHRTSSFVIYFYKHFLNLPIVLHLYWQFSMSGHHHLFFCPCSHLWLSFASSTLILSSSLFFCPAIHSSCCCEKDLLKPQICSDLNALTFNGWSSSSYLGLNQNFVSWLIRSSLSRHISCCFSPLFVYSWMWRSFLP